MKNYNLAAKLYDPLLTQVLRPIRVDIMKKLLEKNDAKILDLCCGTGNQLKILGNNGFTNLLGLDLSQSMLEIAKRGNHDIEILNKDATNTNLQNCSIDIVILSLAIHEKNRYTQENLLKEAYRILKESGSLIIADYDFRKPTSWLTKTVITIIERIAGKEHYNNFKAYIKNRGLSSLIDKTRFLPKAQGTLHRGIKVTEFLKNS